MGVSELESNCNALSNLFQGLINDMRDSVPAFEELANRTTKLHSTLRASIVAIAGFLEAFQKVADAATGSKGATKEIGKSLTRLCLRHRSIESKMKLYANSLMEELAVPLQEKLEDWKKNTVQIDKDHAKDNKKVKGDIKRASSDTIRLQKKTRKGKGDAREKLESAMMGVTEKYSVLEEVEKSYVRKALIEERKHYCDFICCLRPVVDSEMAMVNEIAHLQEIVDHLSALAADPDTLPESSEQVITDLKGTACTYRPKTPPDSPTSDRHSLSSSMNSLVSAPESDGASQRSSSPASRLQALKSSNNNGLLSVASQDSGFTSQDALFARQVVGSASTHSSRNNSNKQRSHGSLEEEKSDSMSVYSSISQGSRGSNDFDTNSLHSGSTNSIPTGSVQPILRHQLERANTLGPMGSRSQGRPHIGNDTFDGPYSSRTSVDMGSMGPPPRPQRMSSIDSTSSSTSSQSLRRNSTNTTSNRSSMPPRTRAKPKPVAMPSVPFMDTEPIYMNTQELAAKIAARRKEEEGANVKAADKTAMTSKPPTTKDEEIREPRCRRYSTGSNIAAAVKEMEASTLALQSLTDNDILIRKAQNDALADAIKELEASTAALNDCLDEPNNRQSVVSSSGYGTTTSNSSASEEVQLITHETVDHHTANSNSSNRTSEKNSEHDRSQPLHEQTQRTTPHISQQQPHSYDRHANELEREATGVEVTNWAGKAVMRRHAGQAKPPPPVRRSSSVTSSINGPADRPQSQRSSKPPVLSPKPKMSSVVEGRNSSRTSTSSVTSESFPSPPPPIPVHQDDEDPYAVPMLCHPIDMSGLPPPPEEFGLDMSMNMDSRVSFNINDLPPPLPDSPAPAYLTSQVLCPPHPVASAHHPVASAHHPVASAHHPVTSAHHPVTSAHHPVASAHHPVASAHHPVASAHQQTTLTHCPPPAQHSTADQQVQNVTLTQSNNTNNSAPWQHAAAKSPRSNSKGSVPPPTLAKKAGKLNTNFLAQLNSTLGGPADKGAPPPPSGNRPSAAAIDSLRSNRAKDSPPRDNLLSQIHGGVKLKKATNVNDRSAPSL